MNFLKRIKKLIFCLKNYELKYNIIEIKLFNIYINYKIKILQNYL